jgi:predicted GNAT family N-acyltransferase
MVESGIIRWSGAFGDLSSDDQLLVARLVKEGGAIKGTLEEITQRLKRTRNLALLRIKLNNRIVGVAALKTPTRTYRADKFAAASVPITGYETALELGYVVIAEDMRGKKLSGCLCDAIAKEIRGPAFATTDSDTMKRNLQRLGFTRAGREWQGRKGALSLWTITPR